MLYSSKTKSNFIYWFKHGTPQKKKGKILKLLGTKKIKQKLKYVTSLYNSITAHAMFMKQSLLWT